MNETQKKAKKVSYQFMIDAARRRRGKGKWNMAETIAILQAIMEKSDEESKELLDDIMLEMQGLA